MPVAPTPGGLTKPQREQLLLLLGLEATSRESAVHHWDEGAAKISAGSMGGLIRRGLADKRVTKATGGGQVTAYWLTDEGLDLAPRVAAALSARARRLSPRFTREARP